MATFSELVSEVAGIVPGYSVFLAKKDVARAYRDILNRRTWSFLIKEGGFNAPSLIQTGTVTITQNSADIVADTLAAAAFDLAQTETPDLLARQFRISTAGALYNVTAWDSGTQTLTVERPILETSAVTSSYMVYCAYLPPPPQALMADGNYDFNRYVSVVDPINGWTIKDCVTKAWLDKRDPRRSTTNLAFYYVNYKNLATDADPNATLNAPLFEFWPHITSGQEFVCLYKSRGLDFTLGNQPLPSMIPDSLVIDRCLYHYTYRWAQINAGRDPKLKGGNWPFLMQDGHRQWLIDLQAAKLQDENVSLQALLGSRWQNRWPFPVDSNFLQGHSTGLEGWGI